jgi:hypothetical protein
LVKGHEDAFYRYALALAYYELCKAIGLSKNKTREVTDDLGKYKFNPHRVYEALLNIKEKKKRSRRKKNKTGDNK